MKKYLVRALCPEPYYYSPLTPHFMEIYANDEEKAREKASRILKLCSNIEVSELTEE